MKLQNFDTVKSLEFDIPNRKLNVYHNGNPDPILTALGTLNLNTTLISTEESNAILKQIQIITNETTLDCTDY